MSDNLCVTMHRRLALLLASAVFALALGGQANATTLEVGTCTMGVQHFSTIQDAVNAAQSDDYVEVCPGTYREQVSITTSITLET